MALDGNERKALYRNLINDPATQTETKKYSFTDWERKLLGDEKAIGKLAQFSVGRNWAIDENDFVERYAPELKAPPTKKATTIPPVGIAAPVAEPAPSMTDMTRQMAFQPPVQEPVEPVGVMAPPAVQEPIPSITETAREMAFKPPVQPQKTPEQEWDEMSFLDKTGQTATEAISGFNRALLKTPSSIVKTASELGVGVLNMLGGNMESEDAVLYSLADKYDKWLDTSETARKFVGKPEYTGLAANVGSGLGQVVSMIAAGPQGASKALLSTPGVLKAVSQKMFSKPSLIAFSQVFNSEFENMKAKGESEQTAFNQGLANALATSPLENLPLINLAERLNKTIGVKLARRVLNAIQQGVEEGGQEAVQQIFSNLTNNQLVESEENIVDWAQGIQPSAEAGGVVGLLIGGLANAKAARKYSKKPAAAPGVEAIPAEEVQDAGYRIAYAKTREEIPQEYSNTIAEIERATTPLGRFGPMEKVFAYKVPTETIDIIPQVPTEVTPEPAVTETAPVAEEVPFEEVPPVTEESIVEEDANVAPLTEEELAQIEETELTPEEEAALLAEEETAPAPAEEEVVSAAPAEEEVVTEEVPAEPVTETPQAGSVGVGGDVESKFDNLVSSKLNSNESEFELQDDFPTSFKGSLPKTGYGKRFKVKKDGKEIGSITLKLDKNGNWGISYVDINKNERRKGYAEKLYKDINKALVKNNQGVLHSDSVWLEDESKTEKRKWVLDGKILTEDEITELKKDIDNLIKLDESGRLLYESEVKSDILPPQQLWEKLVNQGVAEKTSDGRYKFKAVEQSLKEKAQSVAPAAPAPKGRKKKETPVTPAPAVPKKEEAPKPEPKKEEARIEQTKTRAKDSKDAQSHSSDLSGEAYELEDGTGLVQGFNLMGKPVYSGYKKGKRTRVDIDSYTGDVFTAEELSALKELKKELEASEKAAQTQDPFKQQGRVAKTDSVPDNVRKLVEDITKSLGIDKKIIIITDGDFNEGQYQKHGLYGTLAQVRSAKQSASNPYEYGAKRYMSDADAFYIYYDGKLKGDQLFTVISHELGHIVEQEVFNNSSEQTKKAVKEDYEKWLASLTGKTVEEVAKETRDITLADLIEGNTRKFDASKDKYISSFSEYFADNVAKWARTSAKPKSAVDKYFSGIVEAFKKLHDYVFEKGLYSKSLFDWLDGMYEAEPTTTPEFTSEQSSEAATAFDKAKTSKGFDKKHGKGAYKALSDITKNFDDIMDNLSDKIKQDCL